MIYNSLDIIPAKLFLKIEETGDYSLLSTEETKEDLKTLWELLVAENDRIHPNKESNKSLDIYKQIEKHWTKYKSVSAAVYFLNRKKDQELTELIQSYGYRLRSREFKKDLRVIEREVESLKIRIKRLEGQLPKKNKKETSFDEVIMSYGAITNSGFIDTNTITLMQYYALVSIGNKKIKSIDNGGK